MKLRLSRRRHARFRYGPSCQCPQGRGIRTAPKPAKLIAKGLLAVDFWVEVLLKKFEFAQPLQRTIREMAALEPLRFQSVRTRADSALCMVTRQSCWRPSSKVPLPADRRALAGQFPLMAAKPKSAK